MIFTILSGTKKLRGVQRKFKTTGGGCPRQFWGGSLVVDVIVPTKKSNVIWRPAWVVQYFCVVRRCQQTGTKRWPATPRNVHYNAVGFVWHYKTKGHACIPNTGGCQERRQIINSRAHEIRNVWRIYEEYQRVCYCKVKNSKGWQPII